MNELQLPTAPPLPAEVRERALAAVLAEVEQPRRRRGPFLAVAAAVVTTLAVSTSVALVGVDRTELRPSLPMSAPADQAWPPPPDPGGPTSVIDSYFSARCANAVQQTGHAGDFPPVSQWRVRASGSAAIEQTVVVNDSFACLLTPATVTVSRPIETTSADVTVVEMSRGEFVVYNPNKLMITIGMDRQSSRILGGPGPLGDDRHEPARVTFIDAYAGERPAEMRVKLESGQPGGEIRYEGPVPGSPVAVDAPLVTYKDRPIEKRPNGPDAPQLEVCLTKAGAHMLSEPDLWRPVIRHEIPGFPKALVGKVGDVGVGYCLLDPTQWTPERERQAFQPFPLPPLRQPDVTRVVTDGRPFGGSGTAVLRVPPGVVRVEMTVHPPGEAAQKGACSVGDGVAICTIFMNGVFPPTSFTAFTSLDPGIPGTPVAEG